MDTEKFRTLLDEQYTWPEKYRFKFVVKAENKQEVIELLAGHSITERPSRTGKYTSITSQKIIASSSEVIQIYEKMSTVKGIISL